MSPIRVVTDTGADFKPEDAKNAGVGLVPLVVNFGDETFYDRVLDVNDFWEKAQVTQPKSSQPSVGTFEETFAPIVEAGDEVLCVTITGKLSGTYNSACTAAQRFGDKVTVIDSLNLSWGQRFQVEAALDAINEGKSLAEIKELVEDVRLRTRVFILLDTLDYLERGGRAAKLIAIVKKVVNFFNIKPLLTIKEGELGLLGTANSFKRGMLRIYREVEAVAPCARAAVLHTRNFEVVEDFAANVAKRASVAVEDIPIDEIGAAVSTHGGPGLIAAMVLLPPGA